MALVMHIEYQQQKQSGAAESDDMCFLRHRDKLTLTFPMKFYIQTFGHLPNLNNHKTESGASTVSVKMVVQQSKLCMQIWPISSIA